MKKIIASAALYLLLGTAQAQTAQPASFIAPVLTETNNNRLYIPVNLSQKFHDKFQSAKDESWMKTNDGFAVHFSQNGMQELAFLTRKGYCTDYIRYYTEKELPKEVRKLVRSTYYDYQIKNVEEVNHEGTIAYFVTIVEENTWMVVRVVNDNMDVYERHQKG